MTLPFGPALRQPDGTSCGAASVVAARLLAAPDGPAPTAAWFAREVLAEHRRLVRPRDASGRPQAPWPAALGTPPWAVARALGLDGGARYRTRAVRWSREPAFALTAARVAARPVALYVGSRLLPRHVVLAVASTGGGLSVYDPGSGRLVTVTRRAFVTGSLGLSGWDVPWFAVLPDARP